MIPNLLLFLAYLGSALLFHRGLAALAISLAREEYSLGPWRCALLPTIINSTIFVLAHQISLGLMVNWLLILPVFYLELRFLMKLRRWLAFGMALEAVICGLGAALFYRALLAILLQQPLYVFNNLSQSSARWMVLPVILCFLSGFGIFQRYADTRKIQSLCYLLSGKHQVRFLAGSMALTLLFLAMQAYLYDNYDQTVDELRIKLWSLISCIYISIGYLFAIGYALRVSTLYDMCDCNTRMQRDLDQRAREEEALLETIEMDELTGVLTRQAGEGRILDARERRERMCLCMVDLDGLKYVNDNLGHSEGDVYLRSVADVLLHGCRQNRDVVCRFGGDEFLVAFVGTALTDARKRMKSVTAALKERSEATSIPMVISYGLAQWDKGELFQSVLDRADREMYEMKKQHKDQSPDRVRYS